MKIKTGETTQQLRTLAALVEDLGWVPAPTWWLTTICTARSRVPYALIWLYLTHKMHIHSCKKNTHKHEVKLNL